MAGKLTLAHDCVTPSAEGSGACKRSNHEHEPQETLHDSSSASPAGKSPNNAQLSCTQQGKRLVVQFPESNAEELCIEWGNARIILGRDGRVSLEGKHVVVSANESHTVLAGRVRVN